MYINEIQKNGYIWTKNFFCFPDKPDVGIPGTETGEDQERRRVQFVNNLKGVKDTMANAAKEIKVTSQDSNKLVGKKSFLFKITLKY